MKYHNATNSTKSFTPAKRVRSSIIIKSKEEEEEEDEEEEEEEEEEIESDDNEYFYCGEQNEEADNYEPGSPSSSCEEE